MGELSTQSKIRENAARAGLSPPWEQWRVHMLLPLASWEATQSSNLWTATIGPMAARVVSTSWECLTLARPDHARSRAIHTRERMGLAGLPSARKHCPWEPSQGTRV